MTALLPIVAPLPTTVFSNTQSFLAARMPVVDKRHVRPDTNTVTDSHPVKDGHMVFDGDVIADDRPAFNKTAVANIAVATDHGTGLDVRESPQTGAFADLGFLSTKAVLCLK